MLAGRYAPGKAAVQRRAVTGAAVLVAPGPPLHTGNCAAPQSTAALCGRTLAALQLTALILGAGSRGASFGEVMPDARALMTAHGVRHDTLATSSSRTESWADLAYPRDDRGESSFYGGGGLSSSSAPSQPLSEAEERAAQLAKAQVCVGW